MTDGHLTDSDKSDRKVVFKSTMGYVGLTSVQMRALSCVEEKWKSRRLAVDTFVPLLRDIGRHLGNVKGFESDAFDVSLEVLKCLERRRRLENPDSIDIGFSELLSKAVFGADMKAVIFFDLDPHPPPTGCCVIL